MIEREKKERKKLSIRKIENSIESKRKCFKLMI